MKIKHILFPIDFSDFSRALNPEVEWVAKRFDADVTLMHVVEIPATWYGTGEACVISGECIQQLAADAKQQLEDYTIQLPQNRVSRVVAEGDASVNLKIWAEEHHVDLIMMGTRGYGPLRRLLLGSVTMKLLHDLSCPVWTDSGNKPEHLELTRISNIVCALELGEETVPLLRFTKELAQNFGASVQIVHSVPETESRPYRYFDMDLHNYLKECAAQSIAKAQTEAGTDFPVSVTDGYIGQDAAMFAAEPQANLVVIGRGRSQELFGTLRTHSYDIIRQAPCPVLSYCAEGKSIEPEAQKMSETALTVS